MFLFDWRLTLTFTIMLHYAAMDDKIPAEEIAKHPVWTKLDAVDCGDSAADRIIGGLNAGLGDFPWIARLGYIEDDEIDYMCGGALVTDRHVVTAAHCVQKSDYGLVLTTVRLGEHDTRTDPDCELKVCAPAVQDRGIKRIISHPQFNKPAFHNDVAIIELDKPVTLNNYVAPICLPRTAEQLANFKIGDEMTVAGWGKMNMTTEERAKVLQFVNVPVVAPAMCDSFGKGFKLFESEICAGAEHNKDACGGDSGGPLMKVFDTPEGPKSYLVGVVSFGPTICGIKKPGVYASVAYFLKFILDHLV
ncbi:phenoloxidase-activating factor 1 isoform X2 [Spodoptera frugiperda]|uniref:Phenoloxidase-activating factor 1 isoform X2 n=1 Tax=Spodoptera frugiperda TaxID=7108 RepID=A0A9R0DDD5_SPOFR|nr:phenoloxidase-activating factor 1 isoform X2 [Spodoptera frugiperda]